MLPFLSRAPPALVRRSAGAVSMACARRGPTTSAVIVTGRALSQQQCALAVGGFHASQRRWCASATPPPPSSSSSTSGAAAASAPPPPPPKAKHGDSATEAAATTAAAHTQSVVVETTYQAAKKAGVPRKVRHWLVYPTAMAVVCGTLWGLGDFISQRMLGPHATEDEEKSRKAGGGFLAGIDKPRLYSTAAYGGIIAGIGASYWYRWLDAYVGSKVLTGHTSARFIAAKLALEIGVWHPITLTIFWLTVGAAQGQTVSESLADLRAKFVKTLTAEFLLWTPLDVVNFRYTPVHLQPVFVAFGSIIEAVFLSFFRGAH